jgi:hypothetical protein
VRQDAAGAARATAVAGIDPTSTDPNSVGSGHADVQAALRQKVRNQSNRRGFTIIAGYCNGRDPTGFAGGK